MLAFLLVLLVSGAGSVDEREIPELIRSTRPADEFPVWVTLRRAFRDDGEIEANLFAPHALRQLLAHLVREDRDRPAGEDQTAGPADPCDRFSTVLHSDRLEPKPNGSLQDLAKHSEAIYRGRVTRIQLGLLLGEPGSLLEVRVARALRTSAAFDASSSVLVFYPYLRATIGTSRVCKTDPRFSYRPALGDEIILFAYVRPFDELRKLIIPLPEEMRFESKGGDLSMGIGLRTFDDLESEIAGLVAQSERGD